MLSIFTAVSSGGRTSLPHYFTDNLSLAAADQVLTFAAGGSGTSDSQQQSTDVKQKYVRYEKR